MSNRVEALRVFVDFSNLLSEDGLQGLATVIESIYADSFRRFRGGTGLIWTWEVTVNSGDVQREFKAVRSRLLPALKGFVIRHFEIARDRMLSSLGLGTNDLALNVGGRTIIIPALKPSYLRQKRRERRSLNFLTYTGRTREELSSLNLDVQTRGDSVQVTWFVKDMPEKFKLFNRGVSANRQPSRPALDLMFAHLERSILDAWEDIGQGSYNSFDGFIKALA